MKIDSLRVRLILAECRMTQKELSKRCGISRQNISSILRKGRCSPITAGKIAAGLGVPVHDIIEMG